MIEVMKQALAALEVSTDWDVNATGKQAQSMRAINALRTAIEQAENQKPFAWMYTSHWKGDERYFTRYQSELSTYKADKVWPLYTTPPAVKEKNT